MKLHKFPTNSILKIEIKKKNPWDKNNYTKNLKKLKGIILNNLILKDEIEKKN